MEQKRLRELLRLNLQHFAEPEESKSEESETNTVEEPENNPTETEEEITFTPEQQAKIDRIFTERLAREKRKREEAVKKAEQEAEQKRLEENNEFKELYEQTKTQLETFKTDALRTKKESLLVKAGYSENQVPLFSKLLDGETDEELSASLEQLKEVNPPSKKYVDPSLGNWQKQKPSEVDPYQAGRERARKLLKRK